jgi:hypothetical protein
MHQVICADANEPPFRNNHAITGENGLRFLRNLHHSLPLQKIEDFFHIFMLMCRDLLTGLDVDFIHKHQIRAINLFMAQEDTL